MAKCFNVTGLCVPQKHYMVNLTERVRQIQKMIDVGNYFTINCARQYGKTRTVLPANRIFDTLLYNYFLSADELRTSDLYKASLRDKNQFIVDGHLNMRDIWSVFALTRKNRLVFMRLW